MIQIHGGFVRVEKVVKNIGIITSGGDCGGLNGVIKGAALMALSNIRVSVNIHRSSCFSAFATNQRLVVQGTLE